MYRIPSLSGRDVCCSGRKAMGAYEALAASYDRLTNDVNYGAIVAFYEEILKKRG